MLHPPRPQRRHHLLLDMRLLDRPVVQRRRPDVEGAAPGANSISASAALVQAAVSTCTRATLRLGTARHVA